MTLVPSAEDLVRVRLGIAYDGTDFSGWAKQPGLRTVQGVLEEALDTLFRHGARRPRCVVAGRTDAGVHAAGQVAHLDLTAPSSQTRRAGARRRRSRGAARRVDRMNGVLGSDSDVVVTSSELAPEGFDARFSAIWRRYEYRLADAVARARSSGRTFTSRVPRRLSTSSLMHAAAQSLLGLHDFAAFCKPRRVRRPSARCSPSPGSATTRACSWRGSGRRVLPQHGAGARRRLRRRGGGALRHDELVWLRDG